VPNTYEVDYLNSAGAGGSNSIENLSPEPLRGEWNVHIKDRLRWMVWGSIISLTQAQKWIAQDWVGGYRAFRSHAAETVGVCWRLSGTVSNMGARPSN